MTQLRILLVLLFACALIAAALLLQTQEPELAEDTSGPVSTFPITEERELAASEVPISVREDQGQLAEGSAPKYSIRGVAVDDLGAPITTPFRVFALRRGGTAHASVALFEDPQGRFELEYCSEGTWHIRAAAEGYSHSSDAQVHHAPEFAHAELRLTLTRRPRIAGIVLAPDGSPVSKLDVVWATPTEKADIGSSTQIRPGDELGSFFVRNAQVGEFTIHAEHEQWVASERQTFTLRPGEERLNLVLALQEGGRIVGMAYGREHSPAGGLTIRLEPVDANLEDEETHTDVSGRFEAANLPPGTYQVSARLPFPSDISIMGGEEYFDVTPQFRFVSDLLSHEPKAMVEVVDRRTTQVQLNPPPNSPIRISGKLTQAGVPMNGYYLAFARGDNLPPTVEQARTNKDGSYSALVDQAGEYLVAIVDPEGRCAGEFARDIPEGRRHTLNLELPSGEIHGRVLGSSMEYPRQKKVILRHVDGRLSVQSMFGGASVRADTSGKFAFRNLHAGRYALRVQERTDWQAQTDLEGTQQLELTLDPGQVIEGIEFKAELGGNLMGTVRAVSGEPSTSTSLFIRNSAGRLVAQDTTCYGSEFQIRDLPPGTYQVVARTDRLVSSESVTVNIRANQDSKVTLQLAGGTLLEIQTGFDEKALLSVCDTAGREFTNVRGSFKAHKAVFNTGFSLRSRKIGPLAPGEYTIVLTTSDGEKRTQTVRLDGEATRVVRFE